MWRRIHRPPKLCRGIIGDMTSKQKYYYDKSYIRYLKTADGVYLSESIKNMGLEIGRVENIRFIESS